MSKTKLTKLLKSVLDRIKPSPEEARCEKTFAKEIINKLKKTTKAHVVLTGSIAKETFLRESKDVDVFLLFDKKVPKEKFEQLVRNAVERAFPNQRYLISYAEHPYVRLHIGDRRIDVVPAYAIKKASELKSAVDRSVLHTKFVINTLSKNQLNDVLLLKKFLRSNELYGAEIRVQGLSGYLCELLIIHYKSFSNLLKAVSKWKKWIINPVILDTKKYYKKGDYSYLVKRFNTSFIVIDPTDKNRNVAAAVSAANIGKFIKLSRRFLVNTSLNFFNDPEPFYDKLKRMKNKYLIKIKKPQIVDDVLWGQIRKMERMLLDFLKRKDFVVKKILEHANEEVVLAVDFKSTTLTEKKLIFGPFLKLKEDVLKFKKAHFGARFLIKNRRICAYINRDILDAKSALKEFFKKSTLPSHLAKESIKIS